MLGTSNTEEKHDGYAQPHYIFLFDSYVKHSTFDFETRIIYPQKTDHLKNYHPKLPQGDDHSGEKIWGDDSSGVKIWGGDSSGRDLIFLQFWGDDSSGGKVWSDKSSSGKVWSDDFSGENSGVIILQVIQKTTR